MALSMDNKDPASIKSCCSSFYENDLVSKFLGDNFHPGGEELTITLGEQLGLSNDSYVLDVACGSGASALALVKQFNCRVMGIDLSQKNMEKARNKAEEAGLEDRLEFKISDAESLDFDNETFDSVICECALCTFPNKTLAVQEMFRILKPGGSIGITDIVIEHELPEALKGVLSYVLCISGAMSINGYLIALKDAGFKDTIHIDQSHTIRELMEKAEKLLLGWDLAGNVFGIDLEKVFGITLEEAKSMLESGYTEVEKGNIGYGLFKGSK
jgi:ubiquinone/menaquinone biosynthesis C-methylase UbiE